MMSKYFLNNYEKETIILWNEAEKTAEVYTCSPSMMKRMDDLAENHEEIVRTKETEYSKTYVLPKKLIQVRTPVRLSEETRQKYRQRMLELRQKQLKEKEE